MFRATLWPSSPGVGYELVFHDRPKCLGRSIQQPPNVPRQVTCDETEGCCWWRRAGPSQQPKTRLRLQRLVRWSSWVRCGWVCRTGSLSVLDVSRSDPIRSDPAGLFLSSSGYFSCSTVWPYSMRCQLAVPKTLRFRALFHRSNSFNNLFVKLPRATWQMLRR